VLVGLRGLVGQLYREDIAHKVRRGQAGRVNKGLHAGGLTYGYSYVLGDPGKRMIAEDEADIVRRVFREYVEGQTPRDIAHNLNRDRVPPPRGRAWNASTINGNVHRGTGLLHNELYAGRLIWNRVRMIKDPDTGKRVSRPNPKGQWRVVAVPDLAIVSSDLFDAAQARKKARATTHPSHQRRPRHMLTGLLRCGACGAGMSSKGVDKSKRIRIRCSAATESGTCADPKTFYLDTVETAVLNGLTAELRHPEVIAQYVQTYHEERKRLAADTDARRTRLERRLEEVTREIERLVNAIAKGHGDPAVLGPQSTTLNEERKCILAELDRVPAATGVIALHPAVLARYEEQLNQLQTGLAKGIASGDSECADAMRDLVETVTVFRHPSRIGGRRSRNRWAANGTVGRGCLPPRRQRSGGNGGSGRGT